MDPVSMLIFNALAQRRGINLPGIGSLYVLSAPAQMSGDGKLTPPTSQAHFAPEEVQGYDNILNLIGESSGKNEEKCREIYDVWLSGVRTGEGVHIFSVGDITGGIFTASEELERTLNPAGTSFVQLKRQFTPRQIFFWVAVTVVVGGGLAAGLITYLNSRPGQYDAPYAEGTPTAAQPANDTLAAAQTAVTGEETTLEALTESDMTAAKPATEAQPAATQPRSQQAAPEPARQAPTAAKPATPAKPAATTVPAAVHKPASAATAPAKTNATSQAPKSGEMRYYVVVGTYSTDENAERFIASAKKKDPAQSYRKLPLSNGKIMVYTADAPSDAEAQQQRRALNETFPDAWVFKRRAR